MKIELRQIRFFEVLGKELNFHKAAEQLNMTQPALSRAIQQLEARLGVELLKRSKRSVMLTAAGAVFLEEAKKLREDAEKLETRVKEAANGQLGFLTIGYTDFAIGGILPRIVKSFRFAYPEVKLDLIRCFSHDQIQLLKSKEIDFGFLTPPINEEIISHFTVQNDDVMVLIPVNHKLAENDGVHLSQLKNEPFIVGSNTSWQHFNAQITDLCLERGFLPNVVQEAQSSEGIFGLVAAEMGVSLYPSCVENYFRYGVKIQPIVDCSEKIMTEFAWNNSQLSPVQECFIEFVNKYRL